MTNLEHEQKLMQAIEPAIAESYETHMTTGPRKHAGDDFEQATLHPLHTLYEAAALEPREYITSELVDAVETSYQDHIGKYWRQGIDLRPAVTLSGLMNLGTEDNISWYHAKQYAQFRNAPAYVAMLSRWTAEESDHGPLIQLWGEMSGAIPSSDAHRIKVSQIMSGIHVPVDSIVSTNAFTDPQEADTADAHNDLAKVLDPIGRTIMKKLAGHEARHNRMFRRIGEAIYGLEDEELVEYALPIEADTHYRFQMPGEQGIPDFKDMATRIAVHGLFTLEGVRRRQADRVAALGLLEIEPKTDKVRKAQDRIRQKVDPASRINRILTRKIESERERYVEAEQTAGRVPVILGRTVVLGPDKELEIHPEPA